MDKIKFKIIATDGVRTKPRMTQSDKWKAGRDMRPRVAQWYTWRADIIEAYIKAKGKLYDKPVVMGFTFYLSRETQDLDNLVKGIKDALKSYAFIDDKVKYIPEYKYTKYVKLRNPEIKEYAVIEIEEI